jgi:hypothetical protein
VRFSYFTRLSGVFKPALAAVSLLFVNSCAYRFTNLSTTAPSGIKTVAVEAVYDTSREALPHEILWTEMQKAIIENGRLGLVPRAEADALLRTHVQSFSLHPKENALPTGRAPQLTVGEGNEKSWKPMTSVEVPSKEISGMTIEVEVWDLKTREVVFKKTYGSTGTIDNVFWVPEVTLPDSNYLFYEEAVNSKIQAFARDISSKAISDIFLHL